jgi:hypothetical protein
VAPELSCMDRCAHAPVSDIRALSSERRELSQAAPLSRFRG